MPPSVASLTLSPTSEQSRRRRAGQWGQVERNPQARCRIAWPYPPVSAPLAAFSASATANPTACLTATMDL